MSEFGSDANEAVGAEGGSKRVLAQALQAPTACNHENDLCTCNVSNDERANLLKEYLSALADSGWRNIRLMPLDSEGKAPVIQGRCSLGSDEAESLLVRGGTAIQQIRRDGVRGFCLYAGKPSHETEGLVFTDHDRPDLFPADSNTLTVKSGSGTGYHQTFENTGSVQNSKAKGDFDQAGEVRAHNWYVVLPGSIHPSGGIYHVVSNLGVAPLETGDLPEELTPNNQPNASHDSPPVKLDNEVPDSLGEIEASFDVESRYQTMLDSAASETIDAIIEGNLNDTRFADDRHESEGWLAEQVGFYMARDREVVEDVLTTLFQRNPDTDAHTSDSTKSSRRKFLENDQHRKQVLDYAVSKRSEYDPGLGVTKYTRQERPEVGYPIVDRVQDALCDLVLARKVEIVEHPRVDRGETQVYEALRKMQDDDSTPFTVKSVRDGRKRYYYLDGYELKIPEERREELGIEVGL